MASAGARWKLFPRLEVHALCFKLHTDTWFQKQNYKTCRDTSNCSCQLIVSVLWATAKGSHVAQSLRLVTLLQGNVLAPMRAPCMQLRLNLLVLLACALGGAIKQGLHDFDSHTALHEPEVAWLGALTL